MVAVHGHTPSHSIPAVQMMQQQHMAAMQHMLTNLAVRQSESQMGSQAGSAAGGPSVMGGAAGGGSFMGGSVAPPSVANGSFMGAPPGAGSFMGDPAASGSFMGDPSASASFMGGPGGELNLGSQMGPVPPTPQLGDSQFLGSPTAQGSPTQQGEGSQERSTPPARPAPPAVDGAHYPLPPMYYAGVQNGSIMGPMQQPQAPDDRYYSGSFMGSQMGGVPPQRAGSAGADGKSQGGSASPTPRSTVEYHGQQSPNMHGPHAYGPGVQPAATVPQLRRLSSRDGGEEAGSGKRSVMHGTPRSPTHGLPADMVKELQESLEHMPSQESLRLQSASVAGVRSHNVCMHANVKSARAACDHYIPFLWCKLDHPDPNPSHVITTPGTGARFWSLRRA